MTVDFPLSEHLYFHEMTGSTAHPELVDLNRDIASGAPAVMWCLRKWAGDIFEPLREFLGGARLRITSGYRCAKLNNITPGASVYSQHMRGQAGDVALDAGQLERLLVALLPEIHVHDELRSGHRVTVASPLFSFHQARFYPSHGFAHLGLAVGYRDNEITWEAK